MRTPRAKLAASIGALAVIVGAGSYGTFAAFTDTTSNSGNSFTAGDLEITDDDGGATMFTITALAPGDSFTEKCIKVTNAGTVPFDEVALVATVAGAAGGPDESLPAGADGDGLHNDLLVTVQRGTGTVATGGATHSCTGFTSTATLHNNATLSTFTGAADDTSGWTVGASKVYRIVGTLPASTDVAAEGDSATLTLTWNASS